MSKGRFMVFVSMVLGVWAVIHLYVFFRIGSVPWAAAHISHRVLIAAAVVLWISYPLSRFLNYWRLDAVARVLEVVAGNWIGIAFLLFSALLAADVVTLGGLLMPRLAPTVRGWAVAVAAVLSVIALIQGMRPPVVVDYEVKLPGLPVERDGLVMAVITDTHLGTLIGPRWMERVVGRIGEMHPDIIAVVGDLMEGDDRQIQPFIPMLRGLKAPLGVWAVTGNHEFYAGLDRSIRFMEDAGYTVLRDRWAEPVPGLVIAGVDDLTARRQYGMSDHPVEKALEGRPPGATILLSHTPWKADIAASAGAGLMISGHTHNGQIWPFNYVTQISYPLVGGRYMVGGMTVIVCRGTGTWGSRMRLWRPCEILRIRLRAEKSLSGQR
jgi:uncharacterized protein